MCEVLQNPKRLPNLCSHRCLCADSLSRLWGWRLPSSVWAAREAQAHSKERGKKGKRCTLRLVKSFQPCLGGWGMGLAWSLENDRLGNEKGADCQWSRW